MTLNSDAKPWWRRIRVGRKTDTEGSDDATATTERIQRLIQTSRSQSAAPVDVPEDETVGTTPPIQKLWGRDFMLTNGGLDPSEIVPFVEDLLARNKQLEQQSSPAAMTNYIQKLMGELQEVEETVKTQARRDAEAEAAQITAEAKRRAQELIAQSRREASEVARQQAEAILTEARKKAEIAEGQIQIQAQLLLSKAREQVEEHIRLESKTAYDQIIASLSDVLQQAQKVESDWKYRSSQLWRGDAVKLALSEVSFSALPIIQEALATPNATAGVESPPTEASGAQQDEAPPSEEATEVETTPPSEEEEVTPTEVSEAGIVDASAEAEVLTQTLIEEAQTVGTGTASIPEERPLETEPDQPWNEEREPTTVEAPSVPVDTPQEPPQDTLSGEPEEETGQKSPGGTVQNLIRRSTKKRAKKVGSRDSQSTSIEELILPVDDAEPSDLDGRQPEAPEIGSQLNRTEEIILQDETPLEDPQALIGEEGKIEETSVEEPQRGTLQPASDDQEVLEPDEAALKTVYAGDIELELTPPGGSHALGTPVQ